MIPGSLGDGEDHPAREALKDLARELARALAARVCRRCRSPDAAGGSRRQEPGGSGRGDPA